MLGQWGIALGMAPLVSLALAGCVPPFTMEFWYLEEPVTANLSGFEEFEYVWGPCLCDDPLIGGATIRREAAGSYAVQIISFSEDAEVSRDLSENEVARMEELLSEVRFHPAVWAPLIYDIGGDTYRWDGLALYTYREGINPFIDPDDAEAILDFLKDVYAGTATEP